MLDPTLPLHNASLQVRTHGFIGELIGHGKTRAELCRVGTGPQNDWYLFSHKDKKYPTGTRTNRATAAGFWKATGRDKAIYSAAGSGRIGMRKTLVFYKGRSPHGHKSDWIMHEYRLEEIDEAQGGTSVSPQRSVLKSLPV